MGNLKPFKPGDSRINRSGRPKKSVILETLMSEHDTAKVVAAIYEKATKGNLHACQLWIEHKFGKPRQSLEVETDLTWNETKTYVDYSKLSDKALKEILNATKTIEDEAN